MFKLLILAALLLAAHAYIPSPWNWLVTAILVALTYGLPRLFRRWGEEADAAARRHLDALLARHPDIIPTTIVFPPSHRDALVLDETRSVALLLEDVGGNPHIRRFTPANTRRVELICTHWETYAPDESAYEYQRIGIGFQTDERTEPYEFLFLDRRSNTNGVLASSPEYRSAHAAAVELLHQLSFLQKESPV